MGVEDDFEFAKHAKVEIPFYIRKVKNKTCCGDPQNQPEAERVAMIAKLLSEDGGELSFFRIEKPGDVVRAAMALNYERTAANPLLGVLPVCFLAFTEEELDGVRKDPTEDNFVCYWARSHHLNMTFGPEDQERVAGLVAKSKRVPSNFSKSKMKQAEKALFDYGCRSVNSQKDCNCQAGPPEAI